MTEPAKAPSVDIWIDVLCLAALWRAWPLARSNESARVRYLNVSRTMRPLLPLVQKLFSGRLEAITNDAFELPTAEGRCLYDRVTRAYWTLWDHARPRLGIDAAAEAFAARHGTAPHKVVTHLAERLYPTFRRPAEMAELARTACADRWFLVLAGSPFAAALAESETGGTVLTYPTGLVGPQLVPRARHHSDTVIAPTYGHGSVAIAVRVAFRILGTAMAAFFVHPLLRLIPDQRQPAAAVRTTAVAVRQTQRRRHALGLSDLDWLRDATVDPHQVIFVLKDRIDNSWRRDLRAQGITVAWLTANPAALVRLLWRGEGRSALLLCPRPKGVRWGLRHAMETLRTPSHGKDRSVRLALAELAFDAAWHAHLFAAHGIRVHASMEDVNRDKMTVAVAVEQLGGITIGAHWSYRYLFECVNGRADDVLFTWGRATRDALTRRTAIERTYEVGCATDAAFRVTAPITEELVAEHGELFRLGYMDQAILADVHTGPDAHRRLWAVFERLLARHENLVILWKPKRPEEAIAEVRSVYPGIDRLLSAEGVVVVRDDDGGRARPPDVGKACHAVVGLGLSTAAMECGLAGVPALHYHPIGFPDDAFDALAAGRLVFHDDAVLFQALDDAVAGGRSLPNDPSIYDVVDAYRDGRASERMGRIASWYVKEIDGGTPRSSLHKRVSDRVAASSLLTASPPISAA